MASKISRIVFIILSIAGLASCSKHDLPPAETNELATGNGAFEYTYTYLPNKPVNVFYHIPQGNRATMPVVMVFHGDERNAEDYRDMWVAAAEEHGFMVFAPEFSDANFPGGSAYIIGNVYLDGNNPSPTTLNNENVWTFSIIEPLFDYIKQNTGSTAQTYSMFGHSGGGQFVHRFAMFKPEARFDTAVAANSGWFTVPNGVANFPYGIEESPLAAVNPNDYFSRKLIITVGELDNNGNDGTIRHNDEADLQGLNRLARANYFFNQSQGYAAQTSSAFNWQLHVVPNSGHDAVLMSADAVNLLFD